MAAVERHDQIGLKPVGEHDDGGIDRADREVGVSLDQVGDHGPVIGVRGFDVEFVQPADERGFPARTQARRGEPGDLGDDQRRDDELQVSPTEYPGTGDVIGIPPVERGEERARVNDRG